MADTNLSSTNISDLSNQLKDFEVGAKNTEGTNDQKETEFMSNFWSIYNGYYHDIPELKAAIDAKATWTVGKGFKANTMATVTLDRIDGIGIDTFDSILKNMIIISNINGDAYAEIIRAEKTGELINLKPLDPGSMKVIANRKGIITRYVKVNKSGKKKGQTKFRTDQIFHLTKDRTADNILGTSLIPSVQWVIDALQETLEDQRKLMHRNVKPILMFKVDADNDAKMDEFINNMDKAVAKGENIYIPKGNVEVEPVTVPPNATLNPMPWINYLNGEFWKVMRIPQIIVGGSQEFTEATAKIAYLAFQQNVEEEQRIIEQQVWEQLALRIELTFPASLENELLSDEKKDGPNTAQEPSDTVVSGAQE